MTEANAALRTPFRALVEASLTPADYAGPLTGQRLAVFDGAVRRQFIGHDFVAVRVVNPEGVVVYSTIPAEIGSQYEDTDEIAAAVSGSVAARIEDSAAEKSEPLARKYGTLVGGYEAMHDSSGRTLGIAEIYQRYAPIQATVRRVVLILWAVVVAAGLAIYLGQLALIRAAEMKLTAAEREASLTRNRLEESLGDLESHTLGTLQALVTAVDAKDSYTASHSTGVADAAVAIGRRLGLEGHDLALLERAGLLHDVGKIGIPESILLKPGSLTSEERRTIEGHARLGGDIIQSVPFLSDLVPAIVHHHERWDGTGYPDRLAGEAIPIHARVLAVADAYDAMVTDRPYRRALWWFAARKQLVLGSGTQFDPVVASAAIEALRQGETLGHDARRRHKAVLEAADESA